MACAADTKLKWTREIQELALKKITSGLTGQEERRLYHFCSLLTYYHGWEDEEKKSMGELFELKPAHLKLLREATVYWHAVCEGAPAIDVKRPYGNSGEVAYEVMRVLGEGSPRCPHCDGVIISEEKMEEYRKLHRETGKALEIVLCCAGDTVRIGKYENTTYKTWVYRG